MNSDSSTEKEKKIFQRINSKFRQYWRYLFLLIGVYIVCYLFWSFLLAKGTREFLDNKRWGKEQRWLVLGIALFQGILFCLDGFVTSLLKSPFNQMCYAINLVKEIPDKQKDYIITKATESNEHCKETLKKFGILTISGELIRVFIRGKEAGDKELGDYGYLLNISYLIPLALAAIDILLISKQLKQIKKRLVIKSPKVEPNKLTFS